MKDFKKYYYVSAPPEDVYLALTNPLTIQLWSGEEAQMSTDPGSEFSLWGDSISGKNIAFEENKMVQQEWYFGERDEKSIVTIKLHAKEGGCSVEVRQTNIPDEDYQDIVEGWDTAYMGALKEFYEEE